MQIEFDEAKSERNRKMRGFGFELAHEFDFATAHVFEDTRFGYDERRFVAIGRIETKPYRIAFTFRGSVLRVITMHRIHEKEAKRHGI